MAQDINTTLIAVGLMIVAAFAGSLFFRRFRFPDIVFLIGLGVLLGPVFGYVDIEGFRDAAPLVGTIAIIIILFDGGLEIKIKELKSSVASGATLALLVFLATALLCAFVLTTLQALPPTRALLLGMCFGGAGVVIVIPLIQHLGVQSRTRTIVSVEGAVSDVLVVAGVFGLSTAVALRQSDPQDFVRTLFAHFAIGIFAGAGVGYFWATALRRFLERSYEYVLTLAVLFLSYAVIELLHGSGPIAVLVAGLVIGNSRKVARINAPPDAPKATRRKWEYTPVFGVDLQHFHQEMVFFIRAFFFVALGVTLHLDVFADPKFLGVGALLTLAVVAARYWGVMVLFWRSKELEDWDRTAIVLMFPLGLAAAALSLVPWTRFGIEGTENFGDYAAVVIVLTNLAAAFFVYVAARGRVPTRAARAATAHE